MKAFLKELTIKLTILGLALWLLWMSMFVLDHFIPGIAVGIFIWTGLILAGLLPVLLIFLAVRVRSRNRKPNTLSDSRAVKIIFVLAFVAATMTFIKELLY